MPVLKSAKHEHFAQLCAKGEKPAKAYTSVGYSEKGADQSAARLLRDAQICARVAELKTAVVERTIEKAAVDRAWVIASLKEVAERCMQAAPVLDRRGSPVFVETPDGEIVPAFTFNANGANKALQLLGETEGIFIKRVENGKPGDFEHMDDAALDAEIEAMEVLDKARVSSKSADQSA